MAETSKNKIYYNDDENSVADVLTDMKKLAQSVDNAIEKSKYNDTQIKKDISNMKTEITAKDNAQDNKILKLQTEKAELEKELKEAQEDFYQNSIRGQASGEYIHVEDSSNCRARIDISGNQEQATRAGYNKLNMSNAKGGTSGGITCVINEDGSYQFKGTATTTDNGTVNVWFLGYYNSEAPTLFTLEAGTYYINDVVLFSGIKQLNKTLTKIYTFTSEVNITGVRAMSATPGQTYNEVKYPIIAKSNKELTWEQYGVSPSLDYQSPVKTVGSNVNYYNKETEKIGFVLSDGSLQPSNTVWTHSDFIEVNSNEIISITCENKANGQFAIVEYDKNKKFLKHNMCNYVNTEANNKYTITTTSTTKYIIGAYRNNLNMNNIMVVKGAEVLPYNPNCNGMGAVKVTKCNKNIYNKNEEIICNGVGIGANGELFSRSDQKLLIIPITKLETNIAISFTKTFSYNLRYAFSDKIVENIDCKIFDTGYVENSTTINIKVNKTVQNNKHNYLLLSFTKKDIYPDLQVEYKKEVSQYEEHQEQSYIMPVQKEMLTDDYLDWDNGEEVHCWNKLVLNGTENDSNFSVESNGEYTVINCLNILENGKKVDENKILCDKLVSKYGDTSNTEHIRNASSNYPNNIVIYIKSSRLEKSTVAAFKKYLSTNNIIIYYKTATEKRIAFTDEQKAVAKELSNARTYKNVTNITTDSKAILSLDYAKDLETQNQKMQNEIDEIKQLLSTTQTSAMLLDNLQKEVESEVE
mgnify:FL=1